MTRKQILAALRGHGMAETVTDLPGIKAYMALHNITTLSGPDGKSLNVDDVWAKAVALTLTSESEDAIEQNIGGLTPEQKSARDRLKEVRRAQAEAAADGDTDADGALVGAPRFKMAGMSITSAKKAYNARAIRGLTYYPDADTAEYATAQFRLAIAAVKHFTYPQMEADRSIVESAVGKVASTTVNATDGVLVNPEFNNIVLWLTENYGIAERLANVVRFSRTDEWIGKRKTGIMAFVHTNQSGQFTSKDNTYDLVTLQPQKIGLIHYATNELLTDSAVSVADEFTKTIAEARAITYDQDYILGDGSATYGGIYGLKTALPGFGVTTGAYMAGAGNTWAALTIANIDDMPGTVENANNGRLSYLCSRQFFHKVMKRLARAAGGVTAEEMFNKNGLTGMEGAPGANANFGGYPVYFSPIMPTASAASSNVCYFGDFMGASMLGIHTDIQVDVSDHLKFDYDQRAYRAKSRMAINVHGDGRASTFGPIVCLQTTA